MGMWVMSSDSLIYTEQHSCINYFNPNDGLKDINFTGSGQLPDNRTGGERIRVRCVRGGGGPTGNVSGFVELF